MRPDETQEEKLQRKASAYLIMKQPLCYFFYFLLHDNFSLLKKKKKKGSERLQLIDYCTVDRIMYGVASEALKSQCTDFRVLPPELMVNYLTIFLICSLTIGKPQVNLHPVTTVSHMAAVVGSAKKAKTILM